MKNTNYLAFGFLGLIVLWMLSGIADSTPEQLPLEANQKPIHLMKVSTNDINAQTVNREVVIQGELEPIRQVNISAQTASIIEQLIVDKGTEVVTGSPLVRLASEDRKAQLIKSQADVATAELELSGAKKLKRKGLQSDTFVKARQSQLASANASLAQAKLQLSYLNISAPFDGVVETRQLELGSRVDVGDTIMTMVDESTIKAVGLVPQQSISKISLGQPVAVSLLDGRQAKGKITYVARVGDKETHSFKVEAEIDNKNGYLNAGTSAQLSITTGDELGHFLSPSTFALDDQGEVGVKTVTENGVVEFYPIKVIRTEAKGFWVSGLPANARVISLGQGFVSAGEKVEVIPAG